MTREHAPYPPGAPSARGAAHDAKSDGVMTESATDDEAVASMHDRARGALVGLAIGDALGMPTQCLSRARVAELFGQLPGFAAGPIDHPSCAGRPAGTVTDDTVQAFALGRLVVQGHGRVDPYRLIQELAAWDDAQIRAGSVGRLGPSTRRAVRHFRRDGELDGSRGDTNGAAMRIAPLGVACACDAMETLVERVVEADRATHDTRLGHCGAAAVAAAVSAGVAGVPREQIIALALLAVDLAAGRGAPTPGADVGARIAWACGLVRASAEPLDVIDLLVGTSSAAQESVPAAFAIASLYDDPWSACRAAATLGGDSDTIAAMVGAMVGARAGLSAFPAAAVDQLMVANPDIDPLGLADALVAVRLSR
ncbi:MAG: ADP-ribosylglycohydrolase family protein [Dermatophilaceae bacterium]